MPPETLNPTPAAMHIASRAALILETNNLRGGNGAQQALESLKRLVAGLALQSLSPCCFAQWIITHDGLSTADCTALQALAQCPITFVEIAPDTGYYDAKNAGFEQVDASRVDYVVFGDADCRPAPDWLAQLLAPFARSSGAPAAVAGRTSYAAGVVGSALTSIDFMYFPSPLQPQATRNFYANNVAFQREVFAQYRYEPLDGVYRAHCQVMGLRMQAAGVAVAYAPNAHTEHRLPDTRREAIKLRWMRGEDSVGLTPYLVRAYMPPSGQWLGHSGPIGPLCVMGMRLVYSLRAVGCQQMAPLGPLRYAAALLCMLGFSAVDTLGALWRGLGLSKQGVVGRHLQALSYHRD